MFSKPHHGRFLARGVRYLAPFDQFDRWLPRQVAEYARHLASLAAAHAVLWERVDAVRRLGRLPAPSAPCGRSSTTSRRRSPTPR